MCPAHCKRCAGQLGFIEHLLVTVLVTRDQDRKGNKARAHSWVSDRNTSRPVRKIRGGEWEGGGEGGGRGENRRSEGPSRLTALNRHLSALDPSPGVSVRASSGRLTAWPGSLISCHLVRTLPYPPRPSPYSCYKEFYWETWQERPQ